LGDIAIELDRALTTLAPQKVEEFQQLWTEFINNSSKMNLDEGLDRFVQGITEINYEGSIHDRPKVVVTGDFFVRLDPFFMAEIDKLYAEQGILLKPVGLEELLVYPVYDNMTSAAVKLNTIPQTKKSLLLATGKCFRPEGLGYLGNLVGLKLLERTERNIRSKFERTGLLFDQTNDLKAIYDNASEHIHPTIFGEGVLTIGKGVQAIDGEYDGIIVMGPLSCLPFKIAASILKPLCMKTDTPLLIFETDGISTPKTFLRSVQVHIRQVLNKKELKQDMLTNSLVR
jgi:predicted nucleotide-binding protein (sugar kinase/HSP70/actin superfamily)